MFEGWYEEAELILKNMTTEEKIGQMFFPRYTYSTAEREIKTYHPGGFVLFANNIKDHTEQQLIDELEAMRNLSKTYLAYGVDEEGGTVCRVSLYFRPERFPSPQDLYNEGGIKKVLEIDDEKIKLLKKLHFDYNFAPVADISLDEKDFIHKRSLGRDTETTTKYITDDVDFYNENNFTCCLKHFPGYGNNADTHGDVVHDYRKIEQFINNDLVPFIQAGRHNVPMIMFSHNIVVSMDPLYPSSISKKVHDLLRNDFEYSGLIVTDSITMGAITKYTKNESASVLAVKAGNDVIVTSSFEEHYLDVLYAVGNKTLDIDLIEKAAKRVLAWKLKYLLHHPPKKEEVSSEEEHSHSHEEGEDEEEEKDSKGLLVVLYIIIGVTGIGLIALFIFVGYQYKIGNEDNDEEEHDKKEIIKVNVEKTEE